MAFVLPTLYRKDSKGKVRVRHSKVEWFEEDQAALWTVETGIEGGRLIAKENIFTEGKGGRTPYEQACSEAQSKHELKIKKDKYVEDYSALEETENVEYPAPMLAKKYAPKKHRFPMFIQPKMDGNRCLAKVTKDRVNRYVEMWSRSGNFFKDLGHIEEKLVEMANYFFSINPKLREIIFDGELFTWAMPFKDLNGALKRIRKTPEGTIKQREKILRKNGELHQLKKQAQFWWYDIAMLDVPEEERINKRISCAQACGIKDGTTQSTADECAVVNVETKLVKDMMRAESYHKRFREEGFEGSILRDPRGIYRFQARSEHLLKWKEFMDAEFKIIGANENEKMPGTCVFVCETDWGSTFSAMPKGSMKERAQMWEDFQANPEDFVGHLLTVEYFETFEDGTPRFPVAKAVRS